MEMNGVTNTVYQWHGASGELIRNIHRRQARDQNENRNLTPAQAGARQRSTSAWRQVEP